MALQVLAIVTGKECSTHNHSDHHSRYAQPTCNYHITGVDITVVTYQASALMTFSRQCGVRLSFATEEVVTSGLGRILWTPTAAQSVKIGIAGKINRSS